MKNILISIILTPIVAPVLFAAFAMIVLLTIGVGTFAIFTTPAVIVQYLRQREMDKDFIIAKQRIMDTQDQPTGDQK